MIDMQPAVLVAGNLPSVLRRALTDRVYETVRHPVLPGPESFHPDMQLFSAGDGRMVCCPELYAHYAGCCRRVYCFAAVRPFARTTRTISPITHCVSAADCSVCAPIPIP